MPTAALGAFCSTGLCVASAIEVAAATAGDVAASVAAIIGCDMHTQIAPIKRGALSATASYTCCYRTWCMNVRTHEWVLRLSLLFWLPLSDSDSCTIVSTFAVRVETWLLIIMYTWLSSAGNQSRVPSAPCLKLHFSFCTIFVHRQPPTLRMRNVFRRFASLSVALLTFNSIFEFSNRKTSYLGRMQDLHIQTHNGT